MKKTIMLLLFSLSPLMALGQSKTLPEARKAETHFEKKPHVGIFIGPSFAEGDYMTGGELGIDIGFQPVIPYGLGLELSRSEFQLHGDSGSKIHRNNALLKMTYNFGGDIPIIQNSYIGLGLGAAMLGDRAYWAASPIIGFDIPSSDSKEKDYFSTGFFVKYLIYEHNAGPNYLTAGVMLKFWY